MSSGYVLNTSKIATGVALFNFNVDVLCTDSEGSARYLSVIPTTTIDSSLITRCGTYRVEQEIFEKKSKNFSVFSSKNLPIQTSPLAMLLSDCRLKLPSIAEALNIIFPFATIN